MLRLLDALREWWQPATVGRADQEIVAEVQELARVDRRMADDELRGCALRLRQRVRDAQSPLDPRLVVRAFALVHEAMRRTFGIELFDVQLLAGLVLARGQIAEMATGEGKTLVAPLPAFLHSLGGGGVHIATPNAYLAERDFSQIAPVLRLLGVSVGLVPEAGPASAKQAAYACDVTYATGYELGFDYLRDRLAEFRTPRPPLGQRHADRLAGRKSAEHAPMQARHGCAIIDEIDSVLIDEACMPLVLGDGGGHANANAAAYLAAQHVAQFLRRDAHYQIDAKRKRVTLTPAGQRAAHTAVDIGQLRLCRPWTCYVEQAIAAASVYRCDVDYVVRDGQVQLIDEFTGRIQPERSWRDGLHQAIEVARGLPPSPELETAARISRQRFFRLYARICGMTGTAAHSAGEFRNLYRLRVATVPLRRACQRAVLPTRYFRDAESKWRAIVGEVLEAHTTGRPVLVGARTIEVSERIAERLAEHGLSFELLNGKQDHEEAAIVSLAGTYHAVTIATNMAGRGTDIRLGPGVAKLGGLHVIGVERHESRRIDRQLLGRAARQGDPGSGRFYVSADDALLENFGRGLQQRMRQMPHAEGELAANFDDEVEAIQRHAENHARALRRQTLTLDRWLEESAEALRGG